MLLLSLLLNPVRVNIIIDSARQSYCPAVFFLCVLLHLSKRVAKIQPAKTKTFRLSFNLSYRTKVTQSLKNLICTVLKNLVESVISNQGNPTMY